MKSTAEKSKPVNGRGSPRKDRSLASEIVYAENEIARIDSRIERLKAERSALRKWLNRQRKEKK